MQIIRSARPGYFLDLAPHQLDVDEFRELRSLGSNAFTASDFLRASIMLDQACALWRNSELPDIPRTPPMQSIIAKLTAEFHAAQDLLIDARLALGQHREAIPMLRERTIAHPGHEVAWTQLMIALYRSGMRATALDMYLEGLEALRTSSGIDPGPLMRRIHEKILHDEPSLFQRRPDYNS
jgi:DNA-binding SARP family transcriptional activator